MGWRTIGDLPDGGQVQVFLPSGPTDPLHDFHTYRVVRDGRPVASHASLLEVYASLRRHGGTRVTTPTRRREVALLDPDGVITAVNPAWTRFCLDNGGDPGRAGVGRSYLQVCDAADGDRTARAVAAAIRAALSGRLQGRAAVRIRCDSPVLRRRFDVGIAARTDTRGRCAGALVTLTPVPLGR